MDNIDVQIIVKTEGAQKSVESFNKKLGATETVSGKTVNSIKKHFGNVASSVQRQMMVMSSRIKTFGLSAQRTFKKIASVFSPKNFLIAGVALTGIVMGLKKIATEAQKIQGVRNLYSGSDEDKAAFERILRFQRQIGATNDEALNLARTLKRTFSAREAEELSKIISDARFNFDLTGAEVQQLALKFTEMQKKGMLGASAIEMLAKSTRTAKVSTEQIAKATNKTTKEIEALIKKGQLPADFLIAGFKQAQLEMGKTVKSGQAALEESRKDLGAQLQRMQNLFHIFTNDLMVAILGPEASTRDFSEMLAKVNDWLESKIPAAVNAVKTAFDNLTEAVDKVKNVYNQLEKAFQPVIDYFKKNEDALWALKVAGLTYVGFLIATYIPTMVAAGIATVAAMLPVIIIVAKVILIIAILTATFYLLKKAFDITVKGINWLKENWEEVFETVKTKFMDAINYVIDAVGNFIVDLVNSFKQIVQKTKDKFNEVYDTIVDTLTGLVSKVKEIGSDIIDGLINGIKNKFNALKDMVGNLGSLISDTFKGLFKIQSPSKVFEGYGNNLSEGLAKGIEDNKPVLDALNSQNELIVKSNVDGMDQVKTEMKTVNSIITHVFDTVELATVFANFLTALRQIFVPKNNSGNNTTFNTVYNNRETIVKANNVATNNNNNTATETKISTGAQVMPRKSDDNSKGKTVETSKVINNNPQVKMVFNFEGADEQTVQKVKEEIEKIDFEQKLAEAFNNIKMGWA